MIDASSLYVGIIIEIEVIDMKCDSDSGTDLEPAYDLVPAVKAKWEK